MSSDRSNPYELNGRFWFTDKNSVPHGPYDSQSAALMALLQFAEKQRLWKEKSDDARRTRESKAR